MLTNLCQGNLETYLWNKVKLGPTVFIKKRKGPNWGHAVTSATCEVRLWPYSSLNSH